MGDSGDITRLLVLLQRGEKEAEEQLIRAVYPQLRRIAGHYMRAERPDHTLQPTALVNEAYLQLIGRSNREWGNRSHFFAVAAQAMRRILVDHARQKKAQKRDGGRQRVELLDTIAVSEERLDEILAVDEALKRLAEWDPRQAKVVELRFFGGMSDDEVAEVLGVHSRTVKRDWKVAKAWLNGELNMAAKKPR